MSYLADRLLAWYDKNGRFLPWRAPLGRKSDPYRVWLSEVMLQQTTVTAVRPYYQNFLQKWPTVTDLALACDDDVMAAWAGLGYYARARNLLACARVVMSRWGGDFPDTEQELLRLPGVGPYTAAAMAAIAFDRWAVVVDGNVERVMARFRAVRDPLPQSKKQLRILAEELTPEKRSGDYAQAVMDLGATVCTPRSPRCGECPWETDCQGKRLGLVDVLPYKTKSKPKPVRRGVIFWLTRSDRRVVLRRRPEVGLLGGMLEFPSTPWTETSWALDDAERYMPVSVTEWHALPGHVRHTFSHFHLELVVCAGGVSEDCQDKREELLWLSTECLVQAALPSLMRKVAQHVAHHDVPLPAM